MSNLDVARALINAWETRDLKKAASLLSDDFVLTGPAPMPLNKDAYLTFQSVHNEAFPDWKFNAAELQVHEDTIKTTVGITATQTGIFDVATIGIPIPPVPATGKFIHWPVGEEMTLTIKDGKVSSLHVATKPGGGVVGTLERLGVHIPMPSAR